MVPTIKTLMMIFPLPVAFLNNTQRPENDNYLDPDHIRIINNVQYAESQRLLVGY